MPRARLLKPSFFLNESLADLPPLVRLLFAGLWTIADRAGRLEDRPKRIKAALFPWDDVDVEKALDELANSQERFVFRYEVNGAKYIQISKFEDHQSPHMNEAASRLPPPPVNYSRKAAERNSHGASTVPAPDKDQSTPAVALTGSFNQKEQLPPLPPETARGAPTGTLLELKASEPPCSPLNGNGTLRAPKLKTRKRHSSERVTLRQELQFREDEKRDQRSKALFAWLESERQGPQVLNEAQDGLVRLPGREPSREERIAFVREKFAATAEEAEDAVALVEHAQAAARVGRKSAMGTGAAPGGTS